VQESYFLGVLWFGFLGLLGGMGPLSLPFAIFWPFVIPYVWAETKIANRKVKKQ
jgi:hypothetical protein